ASVSQHERLAHGLLPLDISTASPKDTETWFTTRLDFPVQLPQLRYEQLTLVGGRVSNLDDIPVAALKYRVDDTDVSLFVMSTDRYQRLGVDPTPKFKMITRGAYDVIVWDSPRHRAAYALVSEIGPQSCMVCHAKADVPKISRALSVHRAQ